MIPAALVTLALVIAAANWSWRGTGPTGPQPHTGATLPIQPMPDSADTPFPAGEAADPDAGVTKHFGVPVPSRATAGKPMPQYCLLPIGDSLTAGVGDHGSYREPLLKRLRKDSFGVSVVLTAGSQLHPCTPKKPDVPFVKDDGEPHEGHCNWDSTRLLQHWRDLQPQSSGGGAMGAEATNRTRGCSSASFHTALLMAGHNDVFRIAKACRVREGCAATWAPKGHDLPEASLNAPEALPPHLRCAHAMLRKGFHENMFNLTMDLLTQARRPPGRVFRVSGLDETPAVVIGLNPPTGFPCLDAMLHHQIDRVVSRAQTAIDAALGVAGNVPQGWPFAMRRVAVAKFSSFAQGAHTFDSTHPNHIGCQLLASAFADVIEGR
jgi:lysophospholipase L1-like esterase